MKQFIIIFSYLLITTVFLIEEKEYSCRLCSYVSTTVKTVTCVHSKFSVVLDNLNHLGEDTERTALAII